MLRSLKRLYKAFVPEKVRINFYHKIYFKIRSVFYTGNKFYCNCCGKKFRKFLPYGKEQRLNAACPYCNSLERTRFLLFYLQNRTEVFYKPYKVLHFAPEFALEKWLKHLDNLDYLSGDINPALAMNKVDITDICHQDETFDVIICSHILMHLETEEYGLSELYRVLKPGGMALIQTKIDYNLEKTRELDTAGGESLTACGGDPIYRIHGRDVAQRLQSAGFSTEEVRCGEVVPEREIQRLSLLPEEIIFLAFKK